MHHYNYQSKNSTPWDVEFHRPSFCTLPLSELQPARKPRHFTRMTLPFIRNSLSLLKVLLLSPHIQVDNKKHQNQEKLQGCLGRERERAILCWHKTLLLSWRLQLVLLFCEAFWMVSPWCFPSRLGPLILLDCLLAAHVYLAINVVYFNFVASYCSRPLLELLFCECSGPWI